MQNLEHFQSIYRHPHILKGFRFYGIKSLTISVPVNLAKNINKFVLTQTVLFNLKKLLLKM